MISSNGSVGTEPEPVGVAAVQLAQGLVKSTRTTTRVSDPVHPGREILAGLLSQAGRRYRSATFNDYKTDRPGQQAAVAALRSYSEEWPDRFTDGSGIMLYGPRGTGKDHLAIATAGCILMTHSPTAAWVDGQDLFSSMRDRISSDSSESEPIRRLTAPQLLIISDPLPQGDDKTITEYQQSVLWRIIDRRYRDMKPTWVTLNVKDSAEMSRRLGPQLADRLLHGALVVSCDWASYRKPETVVK